MESVIIHGVSKINVIAENDQEFDVVIDKNDKLKISLEPAEQGPWFTSSPNNTDNQKILIKI